MARSHSHTIGAGRRTPPPPGAGGRAVALTMLGATALLVSPIALWLRFGDDDIVRTAAIATASAMLSAGLVYVVRRPRYTAYGVQAPSAAAARRSAGCRAEARRTLSRPTSRMRAGGPASTYRARPPRQARPSRDVRCRASAPRATRRRTRP